MVKILIIQHEESVGVGRLGPWLEEAGAELAFIRPYLGDSVPADASSWDGVIVLGGSAGPQEDHRWPWLPAVRRLQHRTAVEGTPTLNVCLGAQLAAVAHDVEVFRGEVPQVGIHFLELRPEAADDPIFHVLPSRVPAPLWHQERIRNVPAGGVHLMEGTGAPIQAFRIGAASWSVQFHPEADEDTLAAWAREMAPLLERAGQTPAEVLAGFRSHADQIEAAFRPLAHSFVTQCRRALPGNDTTGLVEPCRLSAHK